MKSEFRHLIPIRRRFGDSRKDVRPLDPGALAEELRATLAGEVRFDDGSRALYSTDGSNYRQTPIGVVVPRTVEDVIATVAASRRHGAPILSRGGGTSLAGQCCNVAVVMDFSKYLHAVLQIDPERKRARVQPGCVLDDLRDRAEQWHLTFAPDPSTHTHCTLGGMIGNDSCGVHSVMGGKTVDNVHSLDVLTYDGLRLTVGPTDDVELQRIIDAGGRRGDIYRRLRALVNKYQDLIRERFPNIPRRVSGYNLDQLLPEKGFHVARALVGSEGTCVTVLEAELRLVDSPPARSLLVLGYPDVYSAGDHVPEILESGCIGLEGLDDVLVQDMETVGLHKGAETLLPDGHGWLLVEFGGATKEESDERARDLMGRLTRVGSPPAMKLYDDEALERTVWKVREAGLGATAHVPGKPLTWEGWEDSAVAPERLGEYLRKLRALFNEFDYACALYGHFGQGCVHTRIDFDLETSEGIAKYRRFVERAADLVVSLGGSLSGEHGDGQSRGELLPKMFGNELMQAFREFKAIWDPQNKMNPGKKIDAQPLDVNLRLGTDYSPPQPPTHFQFPDDEHSFTRATLRCVGVGNCRQEGGATMCPSYMVTREEQHSTRGRARMLFEMMQGEVVRDGWGDQHVKDSLDLCLSCKGCKGECPVQVDMATYKAEFLSHYYERHRRPLSAYAIGLIHWVARAASQFPELANWMAHAPGIAAAAKAAAGIAPARTLPRFAEVTFRRWFEARGATALGSPVILWPDTFNDHFHPRVAAAATEVLEAAGYRVMIPKQKLCCGRPLYDYGMLDLAKAKLRQILDSMSAEIQEGIPIVALEPSCAAVFRDELVNLFPNDEQAKRLAGQTFMLGEFLQNNHWQPPKLYRKAVVHGHCHHKSVLKFETDQQILSALGLDHQVLNSGCCGMAGGFGFEKEHYDVSIACGERVLLPAVRAAGDDTLLITDGFSCREQIGQTTGRQAHHLAEVLHMAIRGGRDEVPYPGRLRPRRWPTMVLGGSILAGFGLWLIARRRRKLSK